MYCSTSVRRNEDAICTTAGYIIILNVHVLFHHYA
jgi:hypothetical protein